MNPAWFRNAWSNGNANCMLCCKKISGEDPLSDCEHGNRYNYLQILAMSLPCARESLQFGPQPHLYILKSGPVDGRLLKYSMKILSW